jgi:hypothetical protein
MYQFAKDFASPIATFIATMAAAVITFTFARVQARIAASQRDIALDKLKFDLFSHRYEIYQAAKELLEYVPFITDILESDSNKIRSLYVKIDEARFYFPPDICAVLKAITDRSELFMTHLAERDRETHDDPDKWSRFADILAKDQSELRAAFQTLPQTFEKTFAFKQLTMQRRYDGTT